MSRRRASTPTTPNKRRRILRSEPEAPLLLRRSFDMEKLPTGLVGHIAEFLPITDKLSISNTSKRGRKEIQDLNLDLTGIIVNLNEFTDLYQFRIDKLNARIHDNTSEFRIFDSIRPSEFVIEGRCLTDISQLQSSRLTSLTLSKCFVLDNISVIGNFSALKTLKLVELRNLTIIPTFPKTSPIEEVILNSCSSLESIFNLTSLRKLKTLEINCCKHIGIFPLSILRMKKLVLNRLCFYVLKLEKISSSVTDLTITEVILSELTSSSPSNIEILNIINCRSLSDISCLTSCANLRELTIRENYSIYDFRPIANHEKLTKLYFDKCRELQNCSFLEGCHSLIELKIDESRYLTSLIGVEECKNLKIVKILNCESLYDITHLKDCLSLEILSLNYTLLLNTLPVFPHNFSLKELEIFNCMKLYDVSSLKNCKQLVSATFYNCSDIEHISVLEECLLLRYLEINECHNIKNINITSNLETLKLGRLSLLNGIFIETISSLQHLEMSEIRVRAIDSLKYCPKLSVLKLRECFELISIEDIKECASLKEITLDCLVKLVNLEISAEMVSLERVFVNKCFDLENLGNVSNCKKLTNFAVTKCPKIVEAPNFSACEDLFEINFYGCKELVNISGITSNSLRSLNLGKCQKINNSSFIGRCPNLKTLQLKGCHSLKDIDGIEHLSRLSSIDISACPLLTNTVVLSLCKNLVNIKRKSKE